MNLTKLHDPSRGQMRVIGLMSGSGSNLKKIIEFERQLSRENGSSPFNMVAIFSDRSESNATKIGKEYDIPVVTRDIAGFYAARGKPLKDLQVREEFDYETVNALMPFKAKVAAYGGYMSVATTPLINAFLGVNVHPADLSVMEGDKRKFTGDNAVRDAILTGEKTIASSTHIIEPSVDYGRILMISAPVQVRLGENFDPVDSDLVKKVTKANQERLKEAGDWVIFPKTLLNIAEGKYAEDEKGNLYFDGKPISNGLILD